MQCVPELEAGLGDFRNVFILLSKRWARVNILQNVLTQPGLIVIQKPGNDSKIIAASFSDVLTTMSPSN